MTVPTIRSCGEGVGVQEARVMNGIARNSWGEGNVQFGDLRIASQLFADVVVLASSHHNLQNALEWFAAKCEAPEMRVMTSKSKATVLRWKSRGFCPLGWELVGAQVQISQGLIHT